MKLKHYFWITICPIAIAMSVFLLPAYSKQHLQLHPGFQVSTAGALNVGVYEGVATFAQLKQHGDSGLGALEGLDGEMVVFDGKVYQIKNDGVAYPIADDVKTPFAAVTFFRKERPLRLTGRMTYQ